MRINSLILACIMSLPLFSYTQYNISGVLTDGFGEPIEFANVVLLNISDNQFIEGTITDAKGIFSFKNIRKGNYELKISFLGFKPWTKRFLLHKNIEFGRILLAKNLETLEGVVIRSNKPLIEHKVDRLVFNVEQSIAASGGNALDALKVTPRIRIRNDKIEMIGKGAISVMINGRIQKFSGNDLFIFLKTISSDNIKSIEIISNPPAKYSAEGNSGLINIKLKKSRKDYQNFSLRSVYKQASYPTGLIGGGYNFQKQKFTLSANFVYTNGSTAPIESNIIYYPTSRWEEENKRRDFSNTFSGRIGAKYQISENFSTGFTYRYLKSGPRINDNVRTLIYNNRSEKVDSIIFTKGNYEQDRNFHSLNYYLVYNIDTLGRKLSFDFDFFDYKLDSQRAFKTTTYNTENQITPTSFLSAKNIGLQKINNFSFNLDAVHPIAWINLNYGGQISFIKTINKFGFYDIINKMPVHNTKQSNRFKYRENIQSLYIAAQKEISEKWQAKIGLRMENTQTEGESLTLERKNRNDYVKLFPTAYLSFLPNRDHSFSLNYGRRINRPSFGYLNPFRSVSSPYSYTEGNPFLQPSFTHNIELGYIFKNQLINTFYSSFLKDGFEQVTIVDEDTNIQQIIPKNFVENQTIGLNQTFIYEPFKWWEFNLYSDIYYSSTVSTIPVTVDFLDGWNGEFSMTNNFALNSSETLLLNISYSYITKGVDNLDYNSAFDQLDAALKILLLDKKLALTIYANDVFNSSRPTYTTYSNGLKTSFSNYYDERYFRVSVVFRIGGKVDGLEKRNSNTKAQERID